MTPERLALIEGNISLGWGGAPAAELIAEIRRLWTLRDKLLMWAGHAIDERELLEAISTYSAAAQHPGQLTLGGGEESK
jgi:hypothetical protein